MEDPIRHVFIDGLATSEGSVVKVILIALHGEEIRFTIRLSFQASNNKVEYKALLVGLQVAQAVNASKAIMYYDSQLVTSQISGSYVIKAERVARYVDVYHLIKEKFIEVSIQQIS